MTARTHVKNMFAKLGCRRQIDLIRMVTNHPIWFIDKT
jgi:DNA-binding CsgD family transcriptional regulator